MMELQRQRKRIPGDRIASLLFSIVCAQKAARTIARRVRPKTPMQKVRGFVANVTMRLMGVTPPAEMSVFGEKQEREATLLPRSTVWFVRSLIVLYCGL